jgi:predicted MPP superfamily phosphohydrolase
MMTFIRKNWLRILVYGGLSYCAVDAFLIEPHWIKINRLSLSNNPSVRAVQISDIHFKGDSAYLMRIVNQVNQLAPDVVCFTGDIVEDTRYLAEALDTLGKINVPLYGVPGNHEYWSKASFDQIGEGFRKTGGDWLVDRSVVTLGGKLLVMGKSGKEITTPMDASEFAMPGRKPEWSTASNHSPAPVISDGTALAPSNPISPTSKRILLTHYPAMVDRIKGETYDLILSGHAHGGQVRLPFFGALIVPYGVNGYQVGTYMTAAGRLHVSSGLGTFFLPVRFFCRPEITLIEL